MEILGRRIPGLQDAITSGLESVTAGIAESTKTSGVAALSVAQDSFSFQQVGAAGSVNLPAVAEAAEYAAPDQYFRRFPGTATDSPISSIAIAKTLSDPKFDVPRALQSFGNTSGSMVENALKLWEANHSPAGGYKDHLGMTDHLGDIYWSQHSKEAIGPSLVTDVTYDVGNRFGQDTAEGPSANKSLSMVENALKLNNKEWLNTEAGQEWLRIKMNEFHEEKQKAAEDKMPPDPTISGLSRLTTDPTFSVFERFGREKRSGSSVEGASISGSSDSASNRSIIVVGGKNDASDRSIIVVGGKTSNTYFQTVDDSLNQLKENPTAQTADLFRNQVGAVQNLLNTVDQVVQLQKDFSSSVFERSLRA